MSLAYKLVTTSIKSLTQLICDIDASELSKVPEQGPFILVSNHINFIEVPILYTHLQPRDVTGFVKAETWENPLMGFLFDLWGGIPIKRGEADTTAFRKALEALEQGKILAIAPEGTRSQHGKLQKGHPGIVTLAYMSKAPLLPMCYFGGERIKENLNKLKRTDFNICVGKMFQLKFQEGKPDHHIRNTMVDEVMYQLALLLPAEYRGHYHDISKASTQFIDFL